MNESYETSVPDSGYGPLLGSFVLGGSYVALAMFIHSTRVAELARDYMPKFFLVFLLGVLFLLRDLTHGSHECLGDTHRRRWGGLLFSMIFVMAAVLIILNLGSEYLRIPASIALVCSTLVGGTVFSLLESRECLTERYLGANLAASISHQLAYFGTRSLMNTPAYLEFGLMEHIIDVFVMSLPTLFLLAVVYHIAEVRVSWTIWAEEKIRERLGE